MGRGHREKRRRHKSRSRSRSHSKHRPTRSTSEDHHSRKEAKRSLRRFATSWDIPPVGYEHLSPVQYKAMQASGQIASRILQDVTPNGESASIAMVTRQARRLYVGNIPFNTTESDMIDFFNEQLQRFNGPEGNAVLTCQTNLEKNFAFLEFRSMNEATQTMAFDGISYRGQILKIRRPHDYHPVAAAAMNSSEIVDTTREALAQLGCAPISSTVPDSPHKIYVGNLPTCLYDEQVKELLVTFGKLRGFNLVRDTQTNQSKGFAFCEYVDTSVTDLAIAGLNGMQLGDRKLTVQRSIAGSRNTANQLPVLQVPGLPLDLNIGKSTEVLCLLNMVMPSELVDNEEYEDICNDIKQECTKYGKVKSLKIPRPGDGAIPQAGLGKVYVRFESVDDCKNALNALSGRKFSGRIVMTSFYDLEKYKRKDFQ